MRVNTPLLATVADIIDQLDVVRTPYNNISDNPIIDIASAAAAQTNGAIVQLKAAVAAQKHILGFTLSKIDAGAAGDVYFTFYKGAGGAEQFAVSMGVTLGQTGVTTLYLPMGWDYPFGERISVAVKDDNVGVINYTMAALLLNT